MLSAGPSSRCRFYSCWFLMMATSVEIEAIKIHDDRLGTVAIHSMKRLLWLIILPTDSFESCLISGIFCKREDSGMVDYQTIAELVSQIPVDTWNLLQEIKQRRPAMMLSELIDYSKRVSQAPRRLELGSHTNEPSNPGWGIYNQQRPGPCTAASRRNRRCGGFGFARDHRGRCKTLAQCATTCNPLLGSGVTTQTHR